MSGWENHVTREEVVYQLTEYIGYKTVKQIGLGIYHKRTKFYDDTIFPKKSQIYHEGIRSILADLMAEGLVQEHPHPPHGYRWVMDCNGCAYRRGLGCMFGQPMVFGKMHACTWMTHPSSWRVIDDQLIEVMKLHKVES